MSGSAVLPPPTVLVVDDQRVVRRLAQRILSEAGYRVFEAEDGAEAREVLSFAGHVDLLLVDIVMPRLNGAEFVRELLARQSQQRVLYMSAFPAEVLAQYDVPDLRAPFLAKPFTRDELLAKVDEALRAPAPAAQRRDPSP